MKNNKKIIEEIIVISESTKRRPYASKIKAVLGAGLEYGFDGEVSLLTDQNFIVRIKPQSKEKEEGKLIQKLTATIEGFSTACQAEQMGLKLSLALLWSSVSLKWPLKLEYHTPQPCMVYDRNQNYGNSGFLAASLHARINANNISKLINQVLSVKTDIDPKLLISMELFTSARLESTERARFIGLVSSLEPLSTPKLYENEVIEELTSNYLNMLRKTDGIPEAIKNSIIGRITNLKKESISQAIVRFVNQYFPNNKKVIALVKEVYNIRSSILHEGTFDADLDEKSKALEDIIRYIYSKILDIELQFPENIKELV